MRVSVSKDGLTNLNEGTAIQLRSVHRYKRYHPHDSGLIPVSLHVLVFLEDACSSAMSTH